MEEQQTGETNDIIDSNSDLNIVDDSNDIETERDNLDEGIEVSIDGLEESSGPHGDENNSRETVAPEWVKELRRVHKETVRENRELREKIASIEGAKQKPLSELPKKPEMEDFNYDQYKYEEALKKYWMLESEVESNRKKLELEKESQQKSWQEKIDNFNRQKLELKVPDFESSEMIVENSFDVTQQGIILQGSQNAALLVYAIGKNPDKIKELSSIKDPIKFAFAIAKLENSLKVTNRKAPPPEKSVRGAAPSSGVIDSNLERLRAEAEKTGDYSKVVAYKRQLKFKN